jgi:hypothetical protein
MMGTPDHKPRAAVGPFSGALVEGDAFDRAVRLAGFLAEQGIEDLTVTHPGPRRPCRARSTDLPGLLAALAGEDHTSLVTLETSVATFNVGPSSIDWTTPHPSLATVLLALA